MPCFGCLLGGESVSGDGLRFVSVALVLLLLLLLLLLCVCSWLFTGRCLMRKRICEYTFCSEDTIVLCYTMCVVVVLMETGRHLLLQIMVLMVSLKIID